MKTATCMAEVAVTGGDQPASPMRGFEQLGTTPGPCGE